MAAEAVQCLCETGLGGAALVVTLAMAEALKNNGVEGVKMRAGYMPGGGEGRARGGVAPPVAVAHAWLEVDGA